MSGTKQKKDDDDGTEIEQTLADVQSYPVLTKEISYPGSPRTTLLVIGAGIAVR